MNLTKSHIPPTKSIVNITVMGDYYVLETQLKADLEKGIKRTYLDTYVIVDAEDDSFVSDCYLDWVGLVMKEYEGLMNRRI